jgi:hypothetical protein
MNPTFIKVPGGSTTMVVKIIPGKYRKEAETEKAAFQRFHHSRILRCFSCQKKDDKYEFVLPKACCSLYELIEALKNPSFVPFHVNENRQKFLDWTRENVKLWDPLFSKKGGVVVPPYTPSATLVALLRLVYIIEVLLRFIIIIFIFFRLLIDCVYFY